MENNLQNERRIKQALLLAAFRYFLKQIRTGGVPRTIDNEPVLVIALKVDSLELLESLVDEYLDILARVMEEKKKANA